VGLAVISPPLRGGESATSIKYCAASFVGADGGVCKFQQKLLVVDHHPRLRELRMLCGFLLIAQPLLVGEEGKGPTAVRLFAGHEAIEALIRVYCVLGLPHEVSLEVKGSREVHGICRRQDVVETGVVGVRDEALDGLDLVAL